MKIGLGQYGLRYGIEKPGSSQIQTQHQVYTNEEALLHALARLKQRLEPGHALVFAVMYDDQGRRTVLSTGLH